MTNELLKQASYMYKLGGQEAVEAWFESLSEEDRDLCINELNALWSLFVDWLEALQTRLANFFWQYGKALTGLSEELHLAVEEEEGSDEGS